MDRIKFFYIKSNYYRVIHADGAWGGLTPHAGIFFALYNERSAIPQVTANKIIDNAALGEEIPEETQKKDGVVREVEAGIIMDLAIAEGFHKWLGERINEIHRIKSEKEKKVV